MPDSIGQGGTYRFDAEYRDGTGALVDPTTQLIDILNPSDVALVTDGVPTKQAVGRYYYDYAFAANAPLGPWKAHWTGTINGVAVTGDDYVNVIVGGGMEFPSEGLLTSDDLIASREAVEAGVTEVSGADAESAIALAEAVMNKALGYKVANPATTLTLTGSSLADSLLLPERVRSISSITDSATTITDTYEIRRKGFAIWRRAGWRDNNTIVVTGEFGFATTDDEYVLARHFVLLAAVRHLQKTSATKDKPTPGGALLTGFSSESAQFTFFTPTGNSTGYQDLDILLDQIGRHPSKSHGLYTIGLGSDESVVSLLDFNFTEGRL